MPLANGIRHVWRTVTGARAYGVAVIAFTRDDRLVLVRHSYGTPKWAMPAGGVKRGEAPDVALRREVREELGVELLDLELVRPPEPDESGFSNRTWVYTGRVDGIPTPDMREIIDVQAFDLEALPEPLEKRVRPRLAQLEDLRLS